MYMKPAAVIKFIEPSQCGIVELIEMPPCPSTALSKHHVVVIPSVFFVSKHHMVVIPLHLAGDWKRGRGYVLYGVACRTRQPFWKRFPES